MQTGTYKYFMRGQSTKAGVGDFKVAAQRKANLAQFDRKLRSFRLGEALDAALSTHMPEVGRAFHHAFELLRGSLSMFC